MLVLACSLLLIHCAILRVCSLAADDFLCFVDGIFDLAKSVHIPTDYYAAFDVDLEIVKERFLKVIQDDSTFGHSRFADFDDGIDCVATVSSGNEVEEVLRGRRLELEACVRTALGGLVAWSQRLSHRMRVGGGYSRALPPFAHYRLGVSGGVTTEYASWSPQAFIWADALKLLQKAISDLQSSVSSLSSVLDFVVEAFVTTEQNGRLRAFRRLGYVASSISFTDRYTFDPTVGKNFELLSPVLSVLDNNSTDPNEAFKAILNGFMDYGKKAFVPSRLHEDFEMLLRPAAIRCGMDTDGVHESFSAGYAGLLGIYSKSSDTSTSPGRLFFDGKLSDAIADWLLQDGFVGAISTVLTRFGHSSVGGCGDSLHRRDEFPLPFRRAIGTFLRVAETLLSPWRLGHNMRLQRVVYGLIQLTFALEFHPQRFRSLGLLLAGLGAELGQDSFILPHSALDHKSSEGDQGSAEKGVSEGASVAKLVTIGVLVGGLVCASMIILALCVVLCCWSCRWRRKKLAAAGVTRLEDVKIVSPLCESLMGRQQQER